MSLLQRLKVLPNYTSFLLRKRAPLKLFQILVATRNRSLHTATKFTSMEGSSQHNQSKRHGNVQVVIGDLFKCPDNHSLAHCISADVEMGKGIAVMFYKRFGGYEELWDQDQRPGGLAFLKRGERYIYNLVTKMRYWEKPTYKTLTESLEKMRDHNLCHGVKQLAMPQIGCGLDKLKWHEVRRCINDVYKGTDVVITVYCLEDEKPWQQQPVQRSISFNGGRTDKGGSYDGQRDGGKRQDERPQQQDRGRQNSGGDRQGGGERNRGDRRDGDDRSEKHRSRDRNDDRGEGRGNRGGDDGQRDGGKRQDEGPQQQDRGRQNSGGDRQGGGERDRGDRRDGDDRSEKHRSRDRNDHRGVGRGNRGGDDGQRDGGKRQDEGPQQQDRGRQNSGGDRQGGGERDRGDRRDGDDKSEKHRSRDRNDDRGEGSGNRGGDHHGAGERGRSEKRSGDGRSEQHPKGSSGEGTSQHREDAPKEYNSGRNDEEEGSGQRDDQKSSQDKRDDSNHHDDQERDKGASDETRSKRKRKNKKKKTGEKEKPTKPPTKGFVMQEFTLPTFNLS